MYIIYQKNFNSADPDWNDRKEEAPASSSAAPCLWVISVPKGWRYEMEQSGELWLWCEVLQASSVCVEKGRAANVPQ